MLKENLSSKVKNKTNKKTHNLQEPFLAFELIMLLKADECISERVKTLIPVTQIHAKLFHTR